MAKRYYQSKKDRRDESRGMKRAEARSGYVGYDGSRYIKSTDAAMIKEDWNAPALLPQQVMQKYWEKGPYKMRGYMDDLFEGVQKQMREDAADFERELGPRKY